MSPPKIYVPREVLPRKHGNKFFRHTLDTARARLLIICYSFLLVFVVISGRLADISLLRRGMEGTFAQQRNLYAKSFRADIVDRNGELLATSLRTSSLYANARVVLDPQEAVQDLIQILPELDYKETLQRLQSGKGFIWLARHLTPQKQAEILRLGIPGIYFQQDERRVYPHGELFSHVLGYTNIDNQGLGGVERKFNEYLLSTGEALRLSVDIRVQHVLRDELLAGIERYHALGGSGIVMDVRTGEVVAMVSLPDFDPNHVGKMGSQKEALFNRITLGAYEMGSSFKIFNMALYLESGLANLSAQFDVSGPLRVGRFKITDFHPAQVLTTAEIFTESSNIGAAKMAMQMGGELQKAFFEKLGFFRPASLELSEVGSPLYPKQWSDVTTITASYGYGISISPLQLVTAIGGVVNKGMMQQPTLLKTASADVTKGTRIVSEKTSEIMRKLMYMVVAQGRGKQARAVGYEVGGKTGTANKMVGRSYQKGNNITSFAGVFPMSSPQYIVFIMVDRPQGTKETYGFNAGGWNAAPIAGRVIGRIAPLLQVVPVREESLQPGTHPLLIHARASQGGGH